MSAAGEGLTEPLHNFSSCQEEKSKRISTLGSADDNVGDYIADDNVGDYIIEGNANRSKC